MQMIAELKTLLLEILESAFQNGDVHATQQMGVNMFNTVKREGVVIIQNQNVEVLARIMPSIRSCGTTSLQRNISGAALPLGQVAGYYAIEGLWSGWGGAYGGRFTIEAVLPGDWSETGPGYMNHDRSISSIWTILNDFTYDSETGTTKFLAYVDGYSPAGNSVDATLNVRLYGAAVPGTGPAPVPEPATMLLLGAGLLGLGGLSNQIQQPPSFTPGLWSAKLSIERTPVKIGRRHEVHPWPVPDHTLRQ